ncbi:MAG: hypothetical protein ACREXY_02460 [Gammaproteobacteria bacterium]
MVGGLVEHSERAEAKLDGRRAIDVLAPPTTAKGMTLVRLFFLAGYTLITLSFAVCGFALIWFALLEIWHALGPADTESARERFNAILESIALLTIATAAQWYKGCRANVSDKLGFDPYG